MRIVAKWPRIGDWVLIWSLMPTTSGYLISLKSGPNWGNADQIRQMRTNFRTATRILRQGNPGLHVQTVNGCCYGRTTRFYDRGDYWKLSGQGFWQLLTADPAFYTRIIEPLAHRARERNEEFMRSYGNVINRLVVQFIRDHANPDFSINWPSLIE